MTTKVRTHLEVTGERQAKQDIDGVNKSIKGIGAAGSVATTALGAIGGATVAAAAGLAAVTAAIGGVVTAAKALNAVAQRGGAFDAVASRFEAMADPQLISRLGELSGWQIRQTDIMRSYTQTMEVGLVSAEEYEDWLERITRLAQDRGGDPTQWLQRFTQAISGGGIETLREMGVNTMRVQDQIRELGISLRTEEGRVRAARLAMQQLMETQNEVDNSASHLGDSINAMNTQWDDFLDAQARIIATNPQLLRGFEQLRVEIFGAGGATETLGQNLGTLAIQAAQSVATVVVHFTKSIAGIMRVELEAMEAIQQNPIVRAWLTTTGQADIFDSWITSSRTILSTWERTASAAQRISSAMQASAMDGFEGFGAGETGVRGPGGPGPGPRGRGSERERDLLSEQVDLASELDGILTGIQDQRDIVAETEAEKFMIRREQEDELNALILSHIEEQKIAQAEAAEEQAAAGQRRLQEQRESMIGIANATAGAFNTVGNIMRNVIQQQEAAGKSAEGLKKVYGSFLIAYNSIKAITEFAEAIGAFASQRYASGIAHVASGVAHVAAAVQAASQLGGGSPRVAAAPTSTFVASQPDQVGTGGSTAQSTTVINQYSIARSEPDLGYAFERAVQARQASRLPDPSVQGVGYEL